MCPSNKQNWSDEASASAIVSVGGCLVVDQQCRGSNGKAKIEGIQYLMRRLITTGTQQNEAGRCDEVDKGWSSEHEKSNGIDQGRGRGDSWDCR